MPKRPDVQRVKEKLRAQFKTLMAAHAVVSPKALYPPEVGAGYPSQDLVRRAWNYGQPGTDVFPGSGGADHNGWKALRDRLSGHIGVAFLTATGKAVSYAEIPEPGDGPGYIFDVTVDGEKYLLGVSRAGVVARTQDHPIVSIHPDVVDELLQREAGRWAVR